MRNEWLHMRNLYRNLSAMTMHAGYTGAAWTFETLSHQDHIQSTQSCVIHAKIVHILLLQHTSIV